MTSSTGTLSSKIITYCWCWPPYSYAYCSLNFFVALAILYHYIFMNSCLLKLAGLGIGAKVWVIEQMFSLGFKLNSYTTINRADQRKSLGMGLLRRHQVINSSSVRPTSWQRGKSDRSPDMSVRPRRMKIQKGANKLVTKRADILLQQWFSEMKQIKFREIFKKNQIWINGCIWVIFQDDCGFQGISLFLRLFEWMDHCKRIWRDERWELILQILSLHWTSH